MKKILFALVALATLSFASSCKKDKCVKCTANGVSSTVCEDQYTSVGGVSWEDWKAAAIASGCEEVDK